MPMSQAFQTRLLPVLREVADHFGTPFHIYDEAGIRHTGRQLKQLFANVDGFREYFAVKALPNPTILAIMRSMGFGFDCSSVAELVLSRRVGARGEEIMFTSNNTGPQEFEMAESNGGCILNLDDLTLLGKLSNLPELICFRYNPGAKRAGNSIIGNPVESKYGVSTDQLLDAYRQAVDRGARRFGLHTMLASNELNYRYMVDTTQMLLETVAWITSKLGIEFEFINIGGGLGIPYRPDDKPLDIAAMASEITRLSAVFKARHGWVPKLFMESGRYMTGPHGVLVARAINRKEIYRTYIGLDTSMHALMRPAIYGAYHHITVLDKSVTEGSQVVDVVGSLCENNDKFAIQRPLPPIEDGDLVLIHDTGAHGHAMGFNYNGKLRPKELLLYEDGQVALIRRQESLEDLFATLEFEPMLRRFKG